MSNYDDASPQIVAFTLGGIAFEYDEEKNQKNIAKHGISFRNAARVFFDYDRIEFYDEEHSQNEDIYNTIGDVEAGKTFESVKTDNENVIVGNINQFIPASNEPSAVLARAFGECREGQIPRSSVAHQA